MERLTSKCSIGGPTTCALELDVIPSEPLAVENFGLANVATAANNILNICLYGRSQIGSELLGETKGVSASLVRTDTPRLRKWNRGGLLRLPLRNGADLLVGSLTTTKSAADSAVLQLALNSTGWGNTSLNES